MQRRYAHHTSTSWVLSELWWCRARGHVETTVVESIDLMVTLADMAGLPLPKQALGGESLRPLLLTAEGLEAEVSRRTINCSGSDSRHSVGAELRQQTRLLLCSNCLQHSD